MLVQLSTLGYDWRDVGGQGVGGVEWRKLNVGGSSRKRKQTIGVRNANEEETFASPDFEENGCYKTCVFKCTREFR